MVEGRARSNVYMYVEGSIALSSGLYGVCSKNQLLSSQEAQWLKCEGQLVNVYVGPLTLVSSFKEGGSLVYRYKETFT